MICRDQSKTIVFDAVVDVLPLKNLDSQIIKLMMSLDWILELIKKKNFLNR